MGERRTSPRKTADRRTVTFGRNGGKFGAAVDAAFKAGRPKPIDIETSLARLQGDHYIMSLNDQLNYAGYGFGDHIRVRVDFISPPKNSNKEGK